MIVVIYSSFPNKEAALHVGKYLLNNQLIACSNISPITSQYIWKGKFHEETEYAAYFKTTITKKGEAIKCIKKMHPYEIPIITSEQLVVNNAYKSWMDRVLS